MDNTKSAGVTLSLIALFQFCVWVIYLVVSNPENLTWQNNLNNITSPGSELMPWFYASIISILVSSICAAIYFFKNKKSKSLLLALLIACILQSIPAILYLGWLLKAMYALPIYPAYLAFKNPNNVFKRDTDKAPRPLT